MKKILMIVLSLTMMIAILSSECFTAFAETTTKYWEPLPGCQDSYGYVNGIEHGDQVGVKADTERGGSKITYYGEGTVTGWEFPLLKEGSDYEILSQERNTITIKLLTENKEFPYINVLVDYNEATEKSLSENQITDNSDKNNTTKSNENTKSTTETNTTESTAQPETLTESTNNTLDENTDTNSINKIFIPVIISVAVCALITVTIIIKKRR